jgi:hypothetical protein
MRRSFTFTLSLLFVLVVASAASAQSRWGGISVGVSGGTTGRTSAAAAAARTELVFQGCCYITDAAVAAIEAASAIDLEPAGESFGGQVGGAYQRGVLVVGAEADLSTMRLDATKSVSGGNPDFPAQSFAVTQSMSTRHLLAIRPRAGVAGGPAFVYGTAGLAMTELTYTADFSETVQPSHASTTVAKRVRGTVYGAGIELGGRVSVKLEYLKITFDAVTAESTNFTTFGGFAAPNRTIDHSVTLEPTIIRAGLNVRF